MTVILSHKNGAYEPPNRATLDHLYHRWSPERHNPIEGQKRRVMACKQCNERRGAEYQRSVPIEKLREISGAYPRHLQNN